jgi:hypothetical protein
MSHVWKCKGIYTAIGNFTALIKGVVWTFALNRGCTFVFTTMSKSSFNILFKGHIHKTNDDLNKYPWVNKPTMMYFLCKFSIYLKQMCKCVILNSELIAPGPWRGIRILIIFLYRKQCEKNIVLQYKDNIGMVSVDMRFICIRHETGGLLGRASQYPCFLTSF